MGINFNYSFNDNSDIIIKAAKEQILTALEAVGIQAEGDVKEDGRCRHRQTAQQHCASGRR